MNIVNSEYFDFLLEEYNAKFCVKYVFIFRELADPFIMRSLLVFVQDRKKFLSNKINWIEKRGSGANTAQFQYYFEILDKLEDELNSYISILKNNNIAYEVGKQFKKYWDDENIGIEYLEEKSYFTKDELIKIEQGDYKILDDCDIDHLMKISEISSLDELMQYGD